MFRKLSAIVFIYICTVIAWFILGATVFERTHSQDRKLKAAVGQLWGTRQTQQAPTVTCQYDKEVETRRTEDGKTITEIKKKTITYPVGLDSSSIDVGLALEHRKKGLLWYPTYTVDFAGDFRFTNGSKHERLCRIGFDFPAVGAIYDDFRFAAGEREFRNIEISDGAIDKPVRVKAGATQDFGLSYRSQGMETWNYDFGSDVEQVKNFALAMRTDFLDIDFPQDTISPTGRRPANDGWALEWRYNNLLTGARIGMDLPTRLNPGPWVGRVTLAAPISLFLFFFLLFILTTLRGIPIHPMNYFFIGAAFFSFHLLLAYLVDHISVHLAFAIASAVSILLVVSYMRLVVGGRFAYVDISFSQFVYLVLFSYTFFFEGFTGLAITTLCILTLFVVMQITGRVDWGVLFRQDGNAPAGAIIAGKNST
jgi:inner membrane protein involved in colicin E2 resistance